MYEYGCTSLTFIPNIKNLKELDYSGCNWIYPNV